MRVKVGGNTGPILKWESTGQKLDGKYLGLRDGKQFAGNVKKSKLVDVQTADGKQVTAGAPTALAGKLESLALGTYVWITYTGLARGQSGVQYKNFDVEVDVPEGQVAPTPPAALTGIDALRQKLREAKTVQVADLMIQALETRHGAGTPAFESALADLVKAHGA